MNVDCDGPGYKGINYWRHSWIKWPPGGAKRMLSQENTAVRQGREIGNKWNAGLCVSMPLTVLVMPAT
ncbi:MAG TPA: hypothetical protein DCO71_05020 [Gammaproteobacteria bacterium]|nr:hypothetical protein [Gammaproteobacteria bacterium]